MGVHPHFLGVIFEKHRVQRAAETVYVEILKRVLFALVERTCEVSHAGFERPCQPMLANVCRDRVIG